MRPPGAPPCRGVPAALITTHSTDARRVAEQVEQRAAAPDFDVVGVRAEAEDAERAAPGAGQVEVQHAHPLPGTGGSFFHTVHGVSPEDQSSSYFCRSLAVSIGVQNPSYRNAWSFFALISRSNGSTTSSSPSWR